MSSNKKNLLLIYQGYPRLSQGYQIDEAFELNKYFNLLIISLEWPIYTVCKENILPYILVQNIDEANKDIEKFKPNFIHGHFLNNSKLLLDLSKKYNIKFSLRTHSFDMLVSDSNLSQYKDNINSKFCSTIITFPCFKDKLISLGYKSEKIISSYPSIYIDKFFDISPQLSNDIISGGAFLPKKNIKGFIDLSSKIKKIFPQINIKYYSVPENPHYYQSILEYNQKLNNPVQFITDIQPSQMIYEYKKAKWLIYGACSKLKTVGYPLMICEAQASGVGVIMYNLRDDLKLLIEESGYLYTKDEEVIEIIKKDFNEEKRNKAFELSKRYDIKNNIKELLDKIKN